MRIGFTQQEYKLGICRDVWAVASGVDTVRGLAPRTCEGVVRVAHTGTGGSSSPTYLSQKRTRNKDGKYRKIILFNALQPGIRTPPATSVRTGDTPLVNAGGKASNHPRALTARQIPNLSFS